MIRWLYVGPRSWHRPQPAPVVMEKDTLLPPVMPATNQFELFASEGVEGVNYPEKFYRKRCIMCS